MHPTDVTVERDRSSFAALPEDFGRKIYFESLKALEVAGFKLASYHRASAEGPC